MELFTNLKNMLLCIGRRQNNHHSTSDKTISQYFQNFLLENHLTKPTTDLIRQETGHLHVKIVSRYKTSCYWESFIAKKHGINFFFRCILTRYRNSEKNASYEVLFSLFHKHDSFLSFLLKIYQNHWETISSI